MSFWYDEIHGNQVRFGLKAKDILFEGHSDYQKVVVIDTESFGPTLLIDGLFMASERDEHLYHEMLVHPPMTTAEKIARVLIIGGGDGGSAREVLTYPEVVHLTMVEIDEMVVEVSKKYLPMIGTAWDDPRLELLIADGIEYVKNKQVEPFDVILLDGSDPVGPAEGLFTKEFYEGCRRLLAPGGVFALQSESPFLQQPVFLETAAILQEVFPVVRPYFGSVPIYGSGIWSWTYCANDADPFALKPERLSRVEQNTKHYNGDIHRGAFAVPNNLRSVYASKKSEG